MKLFRLFAVLFVICMSIASIIANDYVVISKEGNIYDKANAKYATENQNGDEVTILPGMVFSTSEHTPGWYKIEYYPGLHAFLSEALVSQKFESPKSGTFTVSNKPATEVIITSSGNSWTLTAGNNEYIGFEAGNILIFTDNSKNVIFTQVDLGDGPIVISYDNAVTKFF